MCLIGTALTAKVRDYAERRSYLLLGSVQPHLSNACADDVADMIAQFFPQSSAAQSLGHSTGYIALVPLVRS